MPLGRYAQPEDIGDVVAFLLSDDARYVTRPDHPGRGRRHDRVNGRVRRHRGWHSNCAGCSRTRRRGVVRSATTMSDRSKRTVNSELEQIVRERAVLSVEQPPVEDQPLDAGGIVEVLAVHAPVDVAPRNRELVHLLAVRDVRDDVVRRAHGCVLRHQTDRVFLDRLVHVGVQRPDVVVVAGER